MFRATVSVGRDQLDGRLRLDFSAKEIVRHLNAPTLSSPLISILFGLRSSRPIEILHKYPPPLRALSYFRLRKCTKRNF